jgi:hypothetical protein
MTLSLETDYQVWEDDGAETVVFVQERRDLPDYRAEVASVLRRQVAAREAAASGGVYTTDDVRFHVPRELLLDAAGDRLAPKPGDAVLEGDDFSAGTYRRWTVLGVEKATLDTRWGLVCRELKVAFDLRDVVEIWSPANAQDAAAGRLAEPYAARLTGLAARIQEVAADVVDERGKRGMRRRYEVYLERRVTVGNEEQLRDARTGAVYEVRGSREPDRIDRLMVIDCERVP